MVRLTDAVAMSAPRETLSSLRQLLAERFPVGTTTSAVSLATGVPAIDEALGGLPAGAVSEIVCATPSCGGQLLLGALLRAVRRERGRVALVDAGDSFDPQSWPDDWLRHVVWARCPDAATALRATDILARDANFQLVALDLRLADAKELRRTPAPFWYRLQRAVEAGGLVLAVFTPFVTVPSARVRLELNRPHPFAALADPREALAHALAPQVQRQRMNATRAG